MRLQKHYVFGMNNPSPEYWKNYAVNEGMVFSYRDIDYTTQTYPSSLHFHDYFELLIIVQGDIHYVHENDIYRPQQGDIILIPPRHLHCSRLNGHETNYKRYVFYFYPDFLNELNANVLLDFAVNLSSRHFYYAPSRSMTTKFLHLAAQIHSALEKNTLPDKLLAKGYLLQLFYLLNSLDWNMPDNTAALPTVMRDMLRYLDEHFTEPISIVDLSDRFFYSRTHISKLFRRYMNTTYIDYILNKRIVLSQRLMETDLPLTEICFRAGFGSLSSFNRAFHKIAGMSPSQFRRAQGGSRGINIEAIHSQNTDGSK